MQSNEIRQKFLDFFQKNGHTIAPSSSLAPDDPSVLLTTAGMQQFKPYYSELNPEKTIHPNIGKPVGKNASSAQKCFRTSDIDEVGDESHLTFFEMLGNFSFGGYGKKEAIKYAYDFIVKEMGLKIDYVTVFEGNEDVSRDEESKKIWQSLDGKLEIKTAGIEDNFWGPTGSLGPCGPTTEIYCKNVSGKSVEIWNIVFNEFFYQGSREELLKGSSDKKLEKLKIFGVDTGMGLERLAMISQNVPTIFDTDLFKSLMSILPQDMLNLTRRVIVDHVRGIAFLISDGARPSNKEAGYILRRLVRRVIAYNVGKEKELFEQVVKQYKDFYPELNAETILSVWREEYAKFAKTLQKGLSELKKNGALDAKSAFRLYESYGLPYEVIKEFSGEKSSQLNRQDFDIEFKKHQEISRAGQEKKFGGHGLILNTGELKATDEKELKIVTRLHTATHLLQSALRQVLGDSVHQAGSDITAERTRFDFTFERKLTSEEIKKTEDLVNGVIENNFTMEYKEMAYEEALKTGALHFFKEKYPEKVKVYTAYSPKNGEVFSREFCGGPHVGNTGEIGKFKIVKEEAVSSGIRRIRGVIK